MARFLTSLLSKIPRKMFFSPKALVRWQVKRETLYVLAGIYLGMFTGLFILSAEHIRNEVIYEIGLVFLGIEGILFGMISQLEERVSKASVVLFGLFAMMVTVATLAVSKFQEVQLGYSSWLPTTYLFLLDGFLFILFTVMFAVGLLPVQSKNPTETEP